MKGEDPIAAAARDAVPDYGTYVSGECPHASVIGYVFTDGEPGDVWACAACMRRFYPACSTCVVVGHRNVVHSRHAEVVVERLDHPGNRADGCRERPGSGA